MSFISICDFVVIFIPKERDRRKLITLLLYCHGPGPGEFCDRISGYKWVLMGTNMGINGSRISRNLVI